MLDIKTAQSKNQVTIVGMLNELSVEEKITGDGRGYVQGKATIRVDQEIDGKLEENVIPVRMFAMKKKKDGTDNPLYKRIIDVRDNFISLAAAEEPSQASRVAITGARVEENMWLDTSTGTVRKNFQISSNFGMKKAKAEDEDCGMFELTGVVASMKDEVDKDGEETGRLKINFVVIGYLGKAEVVELIAENPNAVDFIKNNWEVEDTVSVTGIVNMSYQVKTWYEEQGFGEPIKRTKTVSKNELIITGGSPSGLEETFSYDANDIKAALDERKAKEQELLNGGKSAPIKKAASGFGF